MAANKKYIKYRLLKIVEFKTATRMIKAVGILTLISMSVCSLTAFGFTYAAKIVPKEVAPIFSGDDFAAVPVLTPYPTEIPPETNIADEEPETEEDEEIPADEYAEILPDSIPDEPEEIAAPQPSIETYILSDADRVEKKPTPQPEIPEITTPEPIHYDKINFPAETSGYILSADFSEDVKAVKSDIIHITDDVRITINSHNAKVAICRVGAAGDDFVFNESAFEKYKYTEAYRMYIDLSEGEDYYIIAYDDEENHSDSKKSFISINTVD